MNLGLAGASIAERRAIIDWRDRHLVEAAITLHRACQDLWPLVDDRLKAISWRSVLTEETAFIAREIDPIVLTAVDGALHRLLRAAQLELNRLVEHQLEVESAIESTPRTLEPMLQHLDVIAGLARIGGGVGVAAALPGMAVVSGVAMFGLVATSAVSAPILISGIVLAGAGMATGVVQTSRIKDKRTARIRARVRAHVNAVVLDAGAAGNASLLARVSTAIETAANAALHRIENHAR